MKLDQDRINRLLQAEMDRQWQKRQDQWDKETNARIKLMEEVYGNRAEAVALKKRLEEENLRRKEYEKQILTEELEALRKQDQRSELEEYLVDLEFDI